MNSNRVPSSLADKLLNDPAFREDFVSMPLLINTVDFWLKSNGRKLTEYNRNEARQTTYEIVRWNAGLPDSDSRKKDLSDAKFWTSVSKLMTTYCDIWLGEKEGGIYVKDLLEGLIPEKVAWKVDVFCRARRNWLGLAKNESIVADMSQRVFVALFERNKQAIRSIRYPGTLWSYLQKTVNRLFSNQISKFCFTEEFERSEKKFSYAHLSLYTWSPTKLGAALLKDNLYEERICQPFRGFIKKYYKPEDETYPGGDIADYNIAIKNSLYPVFDDIQREREFPLDDVSLSYNSIRQEAVLQTTDYTPALRDILTLPDPEPPTTEPEHDSGFTPTSPADDEISQEVISDVEALGIIDEIFGTNPKETEELRTVLLELFFEMDYCDRNAKKNSELSEAYALRLEELKAFITNEPRFSKNYMANLSKWKKKVRDRFELGAKKALREERLSAEDIIKVLDFFKANDYLNVYNKVNNTIICI